MPENINIWSQADCWIDESKTRRCTACCTALIVLELSKKAGKPCIHLSTDNNSCTIFNKPELPGTCRGYHCSNDFNPKRRKALIETAFKQGKVTTEEVKLALVVTGLFE
jgi:hypothetical protein